MKEPAISKQDQQLTARLEHLHASIQKPAEITSCVAFQGALIETSARTGLAIHGLKTASRAVADDSTENKAAAIHFHDCARTAIEEYGWLRSQAQNALANPRPTRLNSRAASQTFSDQTLVANIFPLSVSDIGSLGTAALATQLGTTLDLLPKLSAILNADDIRALREAVDTLKAARQRVTDEALDDAPLMETLRAARAQAAGVLVAARCILEGVLRFENSPIDLDTFIIRHNTPSTPTAETVSDSPNDPKA